MKAFRVSHKGTDIAIIKSEKRSRAKTAYWNSAKDAGYPLAFTDIRVIRYPLYDDYTLPENRPVALEFVHYHKPEGEST